jgi:hypothetical protein
MTLAAFLVLAGVLLWPWPTSAPAHGGGGGVDSAARPRSVSVARVAGPSGATVDDAADALALCALALQSGVSALEALEHVAEVSPGPVGHALSVVAAAQRWGQSPEEAWGHVDPLWHPAAVAWSAAHHAGAAPSGIIEAAAVRLREAEGARVEAAIQRSGVLLVLPLGLCFLPGFLCTTVVPVVVHLASGILR